MQVAYAWAVSLGGEAGAKLLTKFGLIEQARRTAAHTHTHTPPGTATRGHGLLGATAGGGGVPAETLVRLPAAVAGIGIPPARLRVRHLPPWYMPFRMRARSRA